MSDTPQQLLHAIRAAPEDDTARLVYADWAEEQGDSARAELIRVQVARARLPSWDREQVRLELRERALLSEHEPRWRAELPELPGVTWGSFRRGFVSRAAFASVDALQSHLAALQQMVPLETLMTRWAPENDWARLGAIEGLRGLMLHGPLLDEADVAGLAQSPLLSTLRELSLVESGMGPQSLRRLLSSPHLGQLEALRLPHHQLDSLEELVQAALPALRELDLSVATFEELASSGRETPTLGPSDAELLASWPALAQLRSLDLSGNAIDTDGLRALLSSPGAAGLQQLHVRGIGPGEEMDEDLSYGMRYELDLSVFEEATDGLSLDVLSMEGWMGPEAAAQFGRARCLSQLKALRLSYLFENEDAFEGLAQAPWMDTLAALDTSHGHTGRLIPMLAARAPAQLHTLRVVSASYSRLQASDIDALASSASFDGLLRLDLSHNRLQAEHLDALAGATGLQSLLSLKVADYRDLDEAAVHRLADSPLGQRLLQLELGKGSPRDRLPEPKRQQVVRSAYRGSLYEL
jgi:uncharacterized protein (TIGR02996 family)